MKRLFAEIEWAEVLSTLDVNEALKYFSEHFTNVLQHCIPLYIH